MRREYNQAGFIKSNVQVAIPRYADKKNGPITKITAKGTRHPYFFKLPDRDTGKFIPAIEAVGAHLMRLVFGPTTVPKTRYVFNPADSDQSYSIAKMIPNFRSATKMSEEEHHKITTCHIAKLHLKILCFQDPDLHGINWGIDVDGNLTLPDNDRLFGDFSNKIRKGTDGFMAPDIMDATDIFNWKNLIYTISDAFSVVSAEDILNTLEFKDLKPYNHPFFNFNAPIFHLDSEDKKTDSLIWKFFYLTKYLMLLTSERVLTIIADHSPADDMFRQSFFDEIMTHKTKIEQTLFYMPTYQDFLTTDLPKYYDVMQSELNNYNAEFLDKNNHEKPHKAHHIVRLDIPHRLNAEIDAFVQTAQACFNADTEAKKAQRDIQLCLSRLQRDANALTTFPKIKQNDADRIKRFDDEIKTSRLPREALAHYTAETKKSLSNFLKNYGLKNTEILTYILNNGKKTLSECIPVFRAHIEKQKKHLKIRENDTITDFLQNIEALTNLLRECGAYFTEEDIKKIMLLVNQHPNSFNLSFADIFLQSVLSEKIPNEFWKWFCYYIEEKKIEQYMPDQKTDFKKFCHSIVHIKKTSVPKMNAALVGNSPYTLQLGYRDIDRTCTAKNILTLLQEKDHCMTLPAADFTMFAAGLKERFNAVRFTGFEKQNVHGSHRIQLTFKEYQLHLLATPLEPRAASAPPETRAISMHSRFLA